MKLYKGKIRLIVKCFAADLAARFRRLDYAVLTARIYRVLQERIFETFETQRPVFGIVEVDGNFFGARRINGIEGFWGMAKVRLAKSKGLPKKTFHLHLN